MPACAGGCRGSAGLCCPCSVAASTSKGTNRRALRLWWVGRCGWCRSWENWKWQWTFMEWWLCSVGLATPGIGAQQERFRSISKLTYFLSRHGFLAFFQQPLPLSLDNCLLFLRVKAWSTPLFFFLLNIFHVVTIIIRPSKWWQKAEAVTRSSFYLRFSVC